MNNLISVKTGLTSTNINPLLNLNWNGPAETFAFFIEEIRNTLLDTQNPIFVVSHADGTSITNQGNFNANEENSNSQSNLLGYSPPFSAEQLGSQDFKKAHNTKYAYYAGAMAHGIASAEMVIALGKAGILSSFGSAGMLPDRLEAEILKIQQALPQGPYAFNLIHSPYEETLERKAIELYIKHGIRTIEAAAFLALTPNIVHYRASGLSQDNSGNIIIKNKIIVKLSRKEIATRFMQPAPDRILKQLIAEGRITEEQAELAKQVPVADDITVEADSGGHTDNRPLVCLLPTILSLRNEIQQQYQYPQPLRIGAAGGISTPEAALGAFMMGADYIVTGSVNQSCVEAGVSQHVKELLAKTDMADVIMAPAADMFEMGVKVQVMKKGSLFPMRAQKLYELYSTYDSIEEIPAAEREKLEKQFFRKDLDEIWQETKQFFEARDPEQIEKAEQNPKRKMALIFRWYLGLSTHWTTTGNEDRKMDYQIWCGPAMGTFNDWVKGSYLEEPTNRKVVDIARNIMNGCAYLYRIQTLKNQGIAFSEQFERYLPVQ